MIILTEIPLKRSSHCHRTTRDQHLWQSQRRSRKRIPTENPLPEDIQVVTDFNTVHEPNKKWKAQSPSPKKLNAAWSKKKNKEEMNNLV